MSVDPTPIGAALGLEPTYSTREAAVLLGRSYSWLDQRLRKDQFVLRDGTSVQPLRTAGGYRRFTLAMLKDIAISSYNHHWFSMDKLKSTLCEVARTALMAMSSSSLRMYSRATATRIAGSTSSTDIFLFPISAGVRRGCLWGWAGCGCVGRPVRSLANLNAACLHIRLQITAPVSD